MERADLRGAWRPPPLGRPLRRGRVPRVPPPELPPGRRRVGAGGGLRRARAQIPNRLRQSRGAGARSAACLRRSRRARLAEHSALPGLHRAGQVVAGRVLDQRTRSDSGACLSASRGAGHLRERNPPAADRGHATSRRDAGPLPRARGAATRAAGGGAMLSRRAASTTPGWRAGSFLFSNSHAPTTISARSGILRLPTPATDREAHLW